MNRVEFGLVQDKGTLQIEKRPWNQSLVFVSLNLCNGLCEMSWFT